MQIKRAASKLIKVEFNIYNNFTEGIPLMNIYLESLVYNMSQLSRPAFRKPIKFLWVSSAFRIDASADQPLKIDEIYKLYTWPNAY